MNIQENYSLKKLNTFGVDVKAKEFVEVNTLDGLRDLVAMNKNTTKKILILGGGSNILFTKDFDGLVIKVEIKGREIVREDDTHVYLEVGSGENWHELVEFAVENNWGGLENMAYIPGTVGGAVAQNIAAYGQNISDIFEELLAIHVSNGEVRSYIFKDCKFTYRNSIFKNELKNHVVIINTILKLVKNPDKFETNYHERKGRYGSLEEELQKVGKEPYTIKDIMNAIINMRKKRLPSIEEFGTCGSFFENPVVTVEKFKELSGKISELQSYPVEKLSYEIKEWGNVEEAQYVKIPAGRLLDELGWRGKWIGKVGVSPSHALCVVTKWEATGQEILDFANQMKQSVLDAYGVELKSEVNIV